MNQTGILVTGSPHSGTRLLMGMLARHPDISVPRDILNYVWEFPSLHYYYTRSLRKTSLGASVYYGDYEEFKVIMDNYLFKTDKNKPYLAIKMPFYPLTNLNFFYKYFEGNLYIIYTHRDQQKIVTSYWRRAEDKRYFYDQQELFNQVKKLEIEKRRQALVNTDLIFPGIVDHCESLKEQWNREYPENPIITADFKKVASSKEAFIKMLHELKIEPKNIENIYEVLNERRLMVNWKTKIKNMIWRTWMGWKMKKPKRAR